MVIAWAPWCIAQTEWTSLLTQGDLANREAKPVELFAFSNQCVGVILTADVPLHQGASALLMMQAHGAGLSKRPVRLCWHRPHPQEPQRQIAGLRFEPNDR